MRTFYNTTICENGGAGIELRGSRRAILREVAFQNNKGPALWLQNLATANVEHSYFANNAGGNWRFESGCHLLVSDSPSAATERLVTSGLHFAECPYCLERINCSETADTPVHCPACGWCFAVNAQGEYLPPLPIDVRCRIEACRQIFPAAAAGTDLCPECLLEYSWDETGNPSRTECPQCSGWIRLTGEDAVVCPSCECCLLVDSLGNVLDFGEDGEE